MQPNGPQAQGILGRIAASNVPSTVFRGAIQPFADFKGSTVIDLLNSLGVKDDISDVLPADALPAPDTPVVAGTIADVPTDYTPIAPDPDATLAAVPNPMIGG